MQPEDPKQDFTPPAETGYVGAAPQEAAPASEISPEPAPQQEPTVVEPKVPQPEAPAVEEPTTPEADTPLQSSEQLPETDPVQWQAAEYHHHEKNALWYLAFGVVVVLLIAAAIFLIKSPTFAILVPIMAVALVLFSRRPPHTMEYVLSNKGLYINDTLHSFSEFKGFGVIHDGNEYSVMLIPVRRFQPGISVYFPEDSGEAIVDVLGTRLPMQPLKLDAFDKVVRALHM